MLLVMQDRAGIYIAALCMAMVSVSRILEIDCFEHVCNTPAFDFHKYDSQSTDLRYLDILDFGTRPVV